MNFRRRAKHILKTGQKQGNLWNYAIEELQKIGIYGTIVDLRGLLRISDNKIARRSSRLINRLRRAAMKKQTLLPLNKVLQHLTQSGYDPIKDAREIVFVKAYKVTRTWSKQTIEYIADIDAQLPYLKSVYGGPGIYNLQNVQVYTEEMPLTFSPS